MKLNSRPQILCIVQLDFQSTLTFKCSFVHFFNFGNMNKKSQRRQTGLYSRPAYLTENLSIKSFFHVNKKALPTTSITNLLN